MQHHTGHRGGGSRGTARPERRAAGARQEQVILKIRTGMENGLRSYNLGNYDDAELQFRRILEYAKWLPTGVELETQRRQAADLLERTKLARRQKQLDEERARQS